MSEKEEKDLLRLMSQCDYAVTHADRFVEDLQKQLNLLDGANIQSIMASEESVLKLMDMLAEAVRHVEMLETRLDGYDEILDQARVGPVASLLFDNFKKTPFQKLNKMFQNIQPNMLPNIQKK